MDVREASSQGPCSLTQLCAAWLLKAQALTTAGAVPSCTQVDFLSQYTWLAHNATSLGVLFLYTLVTNVRPTGLDLVGALKQATWASRSGHFEQACFACHVSHQAAAICLKLLNPILVLFLFCSLSP